MQAAAWQSMFEEGRTFLQPAVTEIMTQRGEAEALSALGPERPRDGIVPMNPRAVRDQVMEGTGQTTEGEDTSLAPQINQRSFEFRLPFTVRDQAFNATAERIVTARTSEFLEQEIRGAVQRAGTSLQALEREMAIARNRVNAAIPSGLAGLQTSVQMSWERGLSAARNQVVARAAAAARAAANNARRETVSAIASEGERLGLAGADPETMASFLAQSTETLAQFGPREGFTVNGQEFGPDPSRTGALTPEAIADQMLDIQRDTYRIQLEADFQRSEAPGAYVRQFEEDVLNGTTPLPIGESLELLRTMESRAYTAQSRLDAAAEAEAERLRTETTTTVNSYVAMSEVGVPVAIPQEERDSILSNLAGRPELIREARTAFAVADAQVETYGMTGPELTQYVERMRGQIAQAAGEGRIDFAGVAVLQSLEDRIESVTGAVNAEVIGLAAIDRQAERGELVENIDFAALREQAAGNEDVLEDIAVTEAFLRDAQTMIQEGLSAEQRENLLEQARSLRAQLAAEGRGLGADAAASSAVLDRLETWSGQLTRLAETDPVAFAEAVGVPLAGFDGVENLGQVAEVLVSRVTALAPRAAAEGVDNVVPLRPAEVAALSETWQASTITQQMSFLATVTQLGEGQSEAIFEAMEQTEPMLYASGMIARGGNVSGAQMILRGSQTDTPMTGDESIALEAARNTVMRDLLETGIIDPSSLDAIDDAAAAYARGRAMATGRDIRPRDLEEGYRVALGGQADGTGGVGSVRFPAGGRQPTFLPPGYDEGRMADWFGSVSEQDIRRMTGGLPVTPTLEPIPVEDFVDSIAGFLPVPGDPNRLVPINEFGQQFLMRGDGDPGLLVLDFSSASARGGASGTFVVSP
jgi:hypothetical protein